MPIYDHTMHEMGEGSIREPMRPKDFTLMRGSFYGHPTTYIIRYEEFERYEDLPDGVKNESIKAEFEQFNKWRRGR